MTKSNTKVAQEVSQVEFEAAKKIALLKHENERLKRQRDNAMLHVKEVEARANYLDIINRDYFNAPSITPIKSDGDTTAILVLSDWHWEENVNPKVVNNLNKYTPKIAKDRVNKLWQNTAMLVDFARKFTNINELVVAVLGDMITGYIHEELVEDNWLSPTEACMEVQDALMGGLTFLHKEIKPEALWIPTCHGNHGRTTKKMRVQTSHANSYEWLMYKQLQWHCAQKQLPYRWQVGDGYHNWMTIQGHRVRFHHGDAIRYQGGVGGITIPVNKAIAAWNKSQPADLDIFGHYHTSKEDAWWVSNGSVIGYNAFALQIKADYEAPSQSLVLVNRKRGKILTMKVFCD